MSTTTREAHAMDTFVFISLFFLFVIGAFAALLSTFAHYWIGALFGFAVMGVCAYGMHAINISINR